ncbi:MAG: RNA polymerase factor sigma-54 [Armatimonadetes bacterium]|nr:RNA polymerase factor sigma-54 [Armatimonadota bacterium]
MRRGKGGEPGLLIEQGLKQTLTQKIDPKLIMASNILQLTSLELQQAIEQELAENPALEIPEDDPCQNCDQPRTLCIDCPFRKQTVTADDVDISVYELEQPFDFASDDEEEFDFIANISSEITLRDHLVSQMRAAVPSEQWVIGEYIISNINDSGYLEGSVEEFALELNKSPEEVESVLKVIQTFDPPGIGARNLQECLRIQLERLEEDDRGNSVALAIVSNYWQEMISGKVGRIARRLKVSIDDVNEAIGFIKKQLNPYPGNGFIPPFQNESDRHGVSVRPDVIVRRTAAGYEIEVTGHEHYFLNINARYRSMYEELKNGKSNKYSKQERQHIVEFVERADLFIRYINERRKTLRQITKAIVEYQQGYLETGSRAFLRPLTRTKLARALKIHESTVSRATANKYVQLPSEEVVPFDFFFDGSVSIKDMIVELIASEDPSNPLSDQQIANILQERGYNVARRTVVKYREAEKILSSRQRKA